MDSNLEFNVKKSYSLRISEEVNFIQRAPKTEVTTHIAGTNLYTGFEKWFPNWEVNSKTT